MNKFNAIILFINSLKIFNLLKFKKDEWNWFIDILDSSDDHKDMKEPLKSSRGLIKKSDSSSRFKQATRSSSDVDDDKEKKGKKKTYIFIIINFYYLLFSYLLFFLLFFLKIFFEVFN